MPVLNTLPRVLVTVGMDHHQFDRLVLWLNRWLETRPELRESVFVQYGTSSHIPLAPGARIVESEQLSSLANGAEVIVCHGGPGCMSDAWERGLIPIVVPRMRRHHEHVDDHQVLFSSMLASHGRIHLANNEAELGALLDEAIAGSARFRSDTREDHGVDEGAVYGAENNGNDGTGEGSAVANFERLVNELMFSPGRRWARNRFGYLIYRKRSTREGQ